MTLLQSMEGKYYDVPEDQAASFEVPREKVRELLAKSGPPPAPQGGPGGAPRGPGGAPPGGGGSPVIIQVLPNGIHGPAHPAGSPPPAGGTDGEVDPYWYYYYWWRNYYW